MKVNLISGICISLLMLSCKQEAPLNYQVIPTPQSVAYKTGHLELPSEVKIAFPESVKKEVDVLQEILSSDFNCRTILDPQNTLADIQLELNTGKTEKEKDGYSIDVSSKGIKITSGTSTGIFYGIQTLRQIIRANEGKLTVQKGTISDYPAFEWRAFMLDEGRHFKGKEVVKQLLDEMARLK